MDGDGHKEPIKYVDRTKLNAFDRQRVKDTWLSTPKPPPKILGIPPLPRRTPFGLSAPALKAKCSPHIEYLAEAKNPLPKVHFVTRAEKEAQKELEEDMTKEELRWLKRVSYPSAPSGVRKAALQGKTTPRIENMALPRLSCLLDTKKMYFGKLNMSQRKFLNKTIKEHFEMFKANYPPEAEKMYVLKNGNLVHVGCAGKILDRGKRMRYICELNKNQRKNFRKRMKLMGMPKKLIVPDKGPDRGPKKKIKEMEPWLRVLSQPRYNVSADKPIDPFKVKSSAKLYVPTERVLIMAKPKTIPPPPPLLDFDGNELPPRREWSFESRKRIVASPRTIELSKPRFVKKKAADDVKEDPFAVVRRALTAYCSPRIIELAEPKRRQTISLK